MPQPQLGYGQQSEATIDQVNQWMRSQPWWQQIKGGSGDISDQQKRAIMQAAQQNGVVIDQGDMEVDRAGNLNPKGHKLRNTLIVAGIAAASIATMGAAGAFAGGAAAGGAGAGAGAGGALASTPIGTGMIGGIAGGTGLGAGAGTLGSTAATLGGLGSAGSWLKTAGTVGEILGNAAQGAHAGRMMDTNAAYGANRNIIDLYATQQRAANERAITDIAQKKYTLEAPQLRASNSVRGDVLANAQDATVSGISPNIPVPQISGGLRPSMFSANTRALGGLMSADALKSQQDGDTFSPLPSTVAPSLLDIPQAGKLDSFLTTAGTIGSLMGQIPYRRKKPVTSYYNDEGGG